jgi:hypothetical protein
MLKDVPNATLQKTFMSLEENLECESCKSCLRTRVKDVVVQWAAVKVGGLFMLFPDGIG